MLFQHYPREMAGLHVDLGLTAALPKLVVDLDSLGRCASNILTGDFGGCLSRLGSLAGKLDVDTGFHVGPGGAPLYRIDRPDDPIAMARDPGSMMNAARNLIAAGLRGHDYVVFEPRSSASATCTRRYPSCLALGILCHEEFRLTCSPDGRVLPYRCDDVANVAGAWFKPPPGRPKLFSRKPSDCP